MLQQQITELMKNNPFYQKFFVKMSLTNNFPFEDYKRVFERLINYSDIFKSEQLNIFSFDNLEKLEDTLVNLIQKHQKISFAKSFLSSKYNHLLSEEAYDIFYELKNKNIPREIIQSQFINKIAAIKSKEDFLSGLQQFFSSILDTNIEKIIEKSKKYNTRIIFEDHHNKILAIEVLDYQASKHLGSSAWCISYSKHHFDNYSEHKSKCIYPLLNFSNHIVFFYDFNLPSSHPKSLIGVTYDSSFDKVLYAFDKNDTRTDKSKFVLKEKPNLNIEESIIISLLDQKMYIEDRNNLYTLLCQDDNSFVIHKNSIIYEHIYNFALKNKKYELIFNLYLKTNQNIIPIIAPRKKPSNFNMIRFLKNSIHDISFEELIKITSIYQNLNSEYKEIINFIFDNYQFKSEEEFDIIHNKYINLFSETILDYLIKFKNFEFINNNFNKFIKYNIVGKTNIPEIKSIFDNKKTSIKFNSIAQISLFINENLIIDEDGFFNKISNYDTQKVLSQLCKTNISESLFFKYIDHCFKRYTYEQEHFFIQSFINYFNKNNLQKHQFVIYLKNYLLNKKLISLKSLEYCSLLFSSFEFKDFFKNGIYIEKNNIKLFNHFKSLNLFEDSTIIFSYFYKDKLLDKNFFNGNYYIDFHNSLLDKKYKKLFEENRVKLDQSTFDEHLTYDLSFIEICFEYFSEEKIKDYILNSNVALIKKIMKFAKE